MAKHTNPSRLGSRSYSSYVNGQLQPGQQGTAAWDSPRLLSSQCLPPAQTRRRKRTRRALLQSIFRSPACSAHHNSPRPRMRNAQTRRRRGARRAAAGGAMSPGVLNAPTFHCV